MTKPTTITKWLKEPASLVLDDIIEAEELIKEHPYFIPARYVSAVVPHSKQAFDANMMGQMQLYKGHWLSLNDFLSNASIEGQGSAAIRSHQVSHVDDNSFGDINDFNEQIDEEEDFNSYEDDGEESSIDDFIQQQQHKPATPEKEIEPTTTQNAVPTITPQPKEEEKNIIVDYIPLVVETPIQTEVITSVNEEEEVPIVLEQKPVTPIMKEASSPEIPPAEEHLIRDQAAAPSTNDAIITPQPTPTRHHREPSLIQPIYTEDYFLHLGIQVPEKPKETTTQPKEEQNQDKDKSLMVVMSFSEWLIHFKTKGEREKAEVEDQKALKTMWQKEKLAAALEEENEEIPENVFEMAVNSITKEDDLASESLAEIMVKQGKYDKAIDMYRKLSLRNPQKNVYFARKIEDINKEKLL